jgi:branched-subunit amino acid ABC-type transport system permease component
MVTAIVVWGLTAIAAAVLAGILAGIKNRDYSFWIAWSFVIPPMVLVLLLLPKLKGARPKQRSYDEQDAAEA